MAIKDSKVFAIAIITIHWDCINSNYIASFVEVGRGYFSCTVTITNNHLITSRCYCYID